MRWLREHLYWTKSRKLGLVVLLVWTLPFLDLSRLSNNSYNNNNHGLVIKTREKEGPFLVSHPVTGAIVVTPERPQLYNVTAPIHVIKSRFMQKQPELISLGWARFKLFQYLCLPSMLHQSTSNFVWLVYTDPACPPKLLQALTDLLAPHPHFYLVKDNTEARFRGGADLEVLEWEDVVTGDVRRLRYLLLQRDRFPFLETRIDADDGLHARFVETIQREALKVLQPDTTHWTYWCIEQALEWHWVGECAVSADHRTYGALLPSRVYENFCHTPGMTLGLYRADDRSSVVSVAHSRLWESLAEAQTPCGPRTRGTDCIIHLDDFQYAAIRARTPTSASMVGVNGQPPDYMEAWDAQRNTTWAYAKEHFRVPRQGCKETLQFFDNNLPAILEDAVVGQCTDGHSCRVRAVIQSPDLCSGLLFLPCLDKVRLTHAFLLSLYISYLIVPSHHRKTPVK
jgi:hypothetical protein